MKARKPGFAILAALVAALLLLPAAASAACPNEEIRAGQKSSALPDGTVHLPDCMALEHVSGAKKENQYARLPEVSSDAKRIRYYSAAAIDEPPNLLSAFWNRYVASRSDSGWTSVAAAPADPDLTAGIGQGNGDVFSPDFTSWFHFAATSTQLELGRGTIYRAGLAKPLSQLSPLLIPVDPGIHWGGNLNQATFQGASADHSRLYFRPGPNQPISATNDMRTGYLPGDPEPLVNTGADLNLYVALLNPAGDPSLELLARDKNGKVWGGNCGAGIGGAVGTLSSFPRNQGAIAADGSRVYLTARAAQPATGACSAANLLRIMQRTETHVGPEIVHLVPNDGAGECDRVSPPCATTAGDDLYQGASVDQGKVYFTTNRQLADSDLDGEFFGGCTGFLLGGCDLYLYDASEPVGEKLIQVSAGEDNASHEAGKEAKVLTGVPAISADGSHVYFVAEGVLTDEPNPEGAVAQTGQKNLYVYQRDEDHPDGRLAFVGAAASNDQGLWSAAPTFRGNAYPVPVTDKDPQGNEIGGDGHVLLFETKASLTADDTDGGFTDIYRYDSQAETLERVSKAAPGGQDNGAYDVGRSPVLIGVAFSLGATNGTDWAEFNRWASEDGETVAFRTSDGLVPEDQNGVVDSYLSKGVSLDRLPGTTDPFDQTDGAALKDRPVLSHDGSVVAFTSRDHLLPSDGDTAIDVYSLRADGGYPIESEPRICSGEECQGAMGALPAGVNASSASTPSNGNVKTKPKSKKRRSCPKGKRKARRAGKVRCVAKKAHKAKRKKAKKRRARAGRKPGGQK